VKKGTSFSMQVKAVLLDMQRMHIRKLTASLENQPEHFEADLYWKFSLWPT